MKGVRTLVGVLVAIVALVVGLWLVQGDQRGAAYTFFAAGVVGVVGALAVKGGVGVLAQGGGTEGAWKALTTSAKPEPPSAP